MYWFGGFFLCGKVYRAKEPRGLQLQSILNGFFFFITLINCYIHQVALFSV